jgi:hypothetical protein
MTDQENSTEIPGSWRLTGFAAQPSHAASLCRQQRIARNISQLFPTKLAHSGGQQGT